MSNRVSPATLRGFSVPVSVIDNTTAGRRLDRDIQEKRADGHMDRCHGRIDPAADLYLPGDWLTLDLIGEARLGEHLREGGILTMRAVSLPGRVGR